METTIPSPQRFRAYANTIRAFLEQMEAKYPVQLPFTTDEERKATTDWLHLTKPVYQADLSRIQKELDTHFADISDYWKNDAALNAAQNRAAHSFSTPLPELAPVIANAIISFAKKHQKARLSFRAIRRITETRLRWYQGLALAIANHLDQTSYEMLLEGKRTATRLLRLITDLQGELEKPGGQYLRELSVLPFLGRIRDQDLQKAKDFLQSDDLEAALTFRKDSYLLSRTTAKELLIANEWAFQSERKDLAFILLGLAAFTPPIDLEQKTLERVWAKHREQKRRIMAATLDSKNRTLDRNRQGKSPYSDPAIPNPSRSPLGG